MGPIELIPLGDLSISRTLKRDLRKAGARTLAEAFALDDRAIESTYWHVVCLDYSYFHGGFMVDGNTLRKAISNGKKSERMIIAVTQGMKCAINIAKGVIVRACWNTTPICFRATSWLVRMW